tara:strand:- start:10628 stop:11134 length:507 start_codon:yes stop_codon:yes gene_type:complete
MTYRQNFSKEFQEKVHSFAKCTKNDNLNEFKIKLELWCIRNEDSIEREYIHLRSNGYEGDIKDKIFKSSRYYFSKKDDKKLEVKKRKKYTGKNDELIRNIKNHINIVGKVAKKPSEAYKNFYEIHKNFINNYKDDLMKKEKYSEKDALNKIKKIYKNKFYINQKSVKK